MVLGLLAACSPGPDLPAQAFAGAPVTTATPAAAADIPRVIVDSILPIEEEIRRFRLNWPGTPVRLSGGADSRDALVSQWVRAVEAADTAALSAMHLTPQEFITLYYPFTQYTRPPYRQKPQLVWFLLTSESNKGLTRVLRRHGGQTLGFRGYTCPERPEAVGENRVWGGCTVRFGETGNTQEFRLFGPLIERDGHWKFLGYGSDY